MFVLKNLEKSSNIGLISLTLVPAMKNGQKFGKFHPEFW
jgi:hypothetical protein